MNTPRRCRVDLMTPEELACRAAIIAIEEMPDAHPLLTEAQTLIGLAQARLADFIDRDDPTQQEVIGYPHRVDGWRDIADAPKDGTRVIVAKWGWVHRDIESVRRALSGSDEEKVWSLWFAVTAHFNAERGYWTDGLEKLVEPTHWMPPPEPPPATAPGGGDAQ